MHDLASRSWEPEREFLAELIRAAGQIPALGACDQIEIEGPVHVSPHARLFLGLLPHKTEKVLVKCYYFSGSDVPDIAEARDQYDALVELNKRRDSDIRFNRFNLVQPFHLFEDRAIIVQSWIEGRSLDKAFADGHTTVRRLCELFRAAGEWLGHFHQFSGERQYEPVSRGLMDEIEGGAKALGRKGRRLARAMQKMRGAQVFDGNELQPIAMLHCDFKPANIIATDSGVFAIDFQLSSRASIYFDIAHFLNSAAIDAMKARRPWLFLRSQMLQREFVAGYVSTAGPIDPLVMMIYLTYDLGRYMLQYGSKTAPGLTDRFKWWTLELLLERRLAKFWSLQRMRSSKP